MTAVKTPGELISLVLEISIYTVLWSIVHEIVYRSTKMPTSIKTIEDKKARDTKFAFFVSYFPALLHAPVISVAGIACMCMYGITYNQPSRWLELFILKYSMSYFIHDTIFGYLRKYNDNLIQVHHILIAAVLGWGLCWGKYGNEAAQGLAQGEITNPIYAVYDVMNMLGYPEARTRPLGIAFMAIFIFIRMFISPVFIWFLQQSDDDLIFKIAYTGMWVISMMLIWMMVNKIAKMLTQVTSSNQIYPENGLVKGFYKTMVSIRPYSQIYNILVCILSSIGIFKYYLAQGSARPKLFN